MVLGDAFSKLEGHNLVSVYPKSIILGQMTNLNVIFLVVVSVYRLVKIWNSPQFPDKYRNSQLTNNTSDVPVRIANDSRMTNWVIAVS